MNTLLIDVGNTYLKYRLVSGSDILQHGNIEAKCLQSLSLLVIPSSVSTILVASVGCDADIDELRAQYLGIDMQVVQSQAKWHDVVNGYVQPEKLGVDRWLGVIEAFYHSQQLPCAVFDLGTALTLDVVDGLGQHKGGYILPGLGLMRDVLQNKTKKVRFDVTLAHKLEYGCDTAGAVLNGTFKVVVDWVNAEISEFLKMYPDGKIYITGGVARAVMPYIHRPVNYDENLILNALMRIASN